MTALTLAKKFFAIIFAAFLCIGISGNNQSFKTLDSDNVKLNVSVFSDVHMEGNCKPRRDFFIQCLDGLKNSEDKIDALALVGDNTMNGQNIENMFFYGLLSNCSPVSTYLPAVGNHDVGNGEGDFSQLSARCVEYFQAFVSRDITKPYYSRIINGYYLIMMGPDASESNSRVISDEQLDWLETAIDEAAKTGLPIFVFNHHPTTSIVQGRERFTQLITKHPNTFLFVGHMHYYIHFTTKYGEYNTPEIWVPCLTNTGEDFSANSMTGLGYQLEVYSDKVCLRGRNYYTGNWTDVQKTYSLY